MTKVAHNGKLVSFYCLCIYTFINKWKLCRTSNFKYLHILLEFSKNITELYIVVVGDLIRAAIDNNDDKSC